VNKPITALGSGLAGVGLMYFFDPTLGKQRRALLVDKADHYLRLAGRAFDVTKRDESQDSGTGRSRQERL
jgi:hypothetical protein